MSATDRSRARLHSFLSRTQAAREGRLNDTQTRRVRHPQAAKPSDTSPIDITGELYYARAENFFLYMTVALGAGIIAMLGGKLLMFHGASQIGMSDAQLQANGSMLLGTVLSFTFAMILRYKSLIEFGAAVTGSALVIFMEPAFVASFPNAWAGFFSASYVADIQAANPEATPWMWDMIKAVHHNPATL